MKILKLIYFIKFRSPFKTNFNYCVIKGSCKEKLLGLCLLGNRDYDEKCTCVVNERLRDLQNYSSLEPTLYPQFYKDGKKFE